MPKLTKHLKNWDKGLINQVEPFSISPSAVSEALNFLTNGDHMALRRGMKVMGTENQGNGKITGLHTAYKNDGTNLLYKTFVRKLKYYDETTEDWVEVGTDTLPEVASGEDISFASYSSIAGAMLFISSPNSSLYQIITANPGSIIDVYDSTINYKGYITIKENRMFLWNRNEANSVIYLSHIDNIVNDLTFVDNEAIGSSGSLTYTGTLAFKGGGAKRACFNVSFTDGVETFTDNKDGTLTGSAGGTGTINYATGAYSVTFNVVAAGSVTADYSWHEATDNGVVDFTYTSPNRTAGEGDFFLQGDGSGKAQAVLSYNDAFYCFHEKKTWFLSLTDDDTNALNKIYREKLGLTNWRAAVDTGDGIFYVDDTEANNPKIRILTFQTDSTLVVPIERSPQLDLSGFYFDQAAIIRWGDYVLVSCRTTDSEFNNRVFAYNLKWNSWDMLDYNVSCFAIYNGALVVGDSISNNVYELFSGLDDLEANINAYCVTAELNLDIENLKVLHELHILGRIQTEQVVKIYASYDNSAFTEIGEIEGSADYVDSGQAVTVGATTVGKYEVGGGSSISAYRYWKRILVHNDRFKTIKIKFVPQRIGYFDFSEIVPHDIRIKTQNLPNKYL